MAARLAKGLSEQPPKRARRGTAGTFAGRRPPKSPHKLKLFEEKKRAYLFAIEKKKNQDGKLVRCPSLNQMEYWNHVSKHLRGRLGAARRARFIPGIVIRVQGLFPGPSWPGPRPGLDRTPGPGQGWAWPAGPGPEETRRNIFSRCPEYQTFFEPGYFPGSRCPV